MPNRLSAIYSDIDGNEIYFSLEVSRSVTRLDAEHAQVAKEYQILDHKGVLILKDGRITLVWGNEESSRTFILVADNLTEQNVVSIAEQFMQKFK